MDVDWVGKKAISTAAYLGDLMVGYLAFEADSRRVAQMGTLLVFLLVEVMVIDSADAMDKSKDDGMVVCWAF